MSKVFIKTIIFIIALILCATNISCNKGKGANNQTDFEYETSIITLDVLGGNATLIKTPTLTFLIDCGAGGDLAKSTVDKIKSYGVTSIDYFILTHMDEKHIGATEHILNAFSVKTVYLPDIPKSFISDYAFYEVHYNYVITKLGEQNVRYNKTYESVSFDGGVLMLLSPLDKGNRNSSYATLFASVSPTENQIDDICPIIYFSYKGVRFVISGDAGISQEELVLKSNQTDLFNKAINAQALINLNEIDFFSLSKHGSDTANSEEFIKLLKPKNALISVSSENQGCPKSSVLENIYNAQNSCRFYSTMLVGDICAYVNANGEYKVTTQKELQK